MKRIFAAILFEDKNYLAFVDICPVNEGHTLIIPKKHYVLVEEMEEQAYMQLFVIGRQLAHQIKTNIPPTTAINYLIADGKDAGQEIHHVHLHIIPRFPKDGFGFKFGPKYGKLLTEKERTLIAEKISKK
jgi:diadenosine tetraphosphate (Ap4A) HIT family hydrolase